MNSISIIRAPSLSVVGVYPVNILKTVVAGTFLQILEVRIGAKATAGERLAKSAHTVDPQFLPMISFRGGHQ